MFPITSRYYGVKTATIQLADGRPVRYLLRRFIPSADRFALLQEHTVSEGDRLDNLAAKYLGDPEAFWRIADANEAMAPEELTDLIGRALRITLPEGIPNQTTA
jgi:phage tail protein X